MRARTTRRLGDLELQILNVLWERGPSSVRDVLEALPTPKPIIPLSPFPRSVA